MYVILYASFGRLERLSYAGIQLFLAGLGEPPLFITEHIHSILFL